MRKNVADKYRFSNSNFHGIAGKLLKDRKNLVAGKTFGIGLNTMIFILREYYKQLCYMEKKLVNNRMYVKL